MASRRKPYKFNIVNGSEVFKKFLCDFQFVLRPFVAAKYFCVREGIIKDDFVVVATSTSLRGGKVSRDLHNLIKISLAISREENSSNAEENSVRSQTKIEFDILQQMTQKINLVKWEVLFWGWSLVFLDEIVIINHYYFELTRLWNTLRQFAARYFGVNQEKMFFKEDLVIFDG